ncbi:MAG TPA: MFS transporter [Terriglobales bacterium]|nr:MFS transporter [Terriglobales bacterium]
MTRAPSPAAVVCLLSFVHFVGAQMRGPLIPLYGQANGADATLVGFIVAAHMAVAAIGSIPLGRAADRWGRRRLVVAGIAVGLLTSLMLPLVEHPLALMAVYGLAGFGIAAYTPSALALIGDATPVAQAARAYAWHSTAHYGAIALGPFFGALAAERWGYRPAFIASAAVLVLALAMALHAPLPQRVVVREPARPVTEVTRNVSVWAGWIAGVSGMVIQGVAFTFVPLLALEQGLTPAAIGGIFLALGAANTVSRGPAGWLMDRTAGATAYALAGLVLASAVTALLPHGGSFAALLLLATVFGGLSGIAFVGVTAALAASASPSTRGLVMGGYSTALYLGLGIGAFAHGPIVERAGYAVGFAVGGAVGAIGALLAGILWAVGADYARDGRTADRSSMGRKARALGDNSRPSP